MVVITFRLVLLGFELFLFGFLIGHGLAYFLYTTKK